MKIPNKMFQIGRSIRTYCTLRPPLFRQTPRHVMVPIMQYLNKNLKRHHFKTNQKKLRRNTYAF
jgi:hypothetical protein